MGKPAELVGALAGGNSTLQARQLLLRRREIARMLKHLSVLPG